MNSDHLINQASNVIAEFYRTHTYGCELYIKNGSVLCRKAALNSDTDDKNLYISRSQQTYGLSDRQWTLTGTALLNLYNKEKACQEHPKH